MADRPRILVVDDERPVLDGVRRLLGGAYQLELVDSAEVAIDLVAQGARFDLVLCDVLMPDMSGIELKESVSLWSSELAERWVWMTSVAGGMSEPTLAKPFTSDELRITVKAMLERSRG